MPSKEEPALPCAVCIQTHPPELMRHPRLCKFCEIDAVRAELNRLEGELNFHPPKGTPMQLPCRRCKVRNWWVNLDSEGRCAACADEVKELSDELLRVPLKPSDFDIDAELDRIMREDF